MSHCVANTLPDATGYSESQGIMDPADPSPLEQLSHAFGFHPAAKIGSGTQATDAERSDERAGAQRKDPSYIPGFRC
jgi:hypothetical protein